MKNTDVVLGVGVIREQINFRVPIGIKMGIKEEIKRQGRKRDVVAERVWENFLKLKPSERDRICSPRMMHH